MKRIFLKAIAGLIAGVAFAYVHDAAAGADGFYTVSISGITPNVVAVGSMHDARFGGQPQDLIGCYYNAMTNFVECDAVQGLGPGVVKRFTCGVTAPSAGLVALVTGINEASYLVLTLAPAGRCGGIEVYNYSDNL
jgi:hypothetical protein